MIRVIFLCMAMMVAGHAARALDVAVATNFAAPMGELGAVFTRETGEAVAITAGSTGKLYAQIRAGAPFDLFLSADQDRPARLLAEGRAVAGSRITYATGQLVLWSVDAARVPAIGPTALDAADLHHLAIANPELAPYGAAAIEVLTALGRLETLQNRLVYGQNVGQAHALAASGNAQLGLIAASTLGTEFEGSAWPVPPELHSPIRQDAVALRDTAETAAFLTFLRSEAAQQIIAKHGLFPGVGP